MEQIEDNNFNSFSCQELFYYLLDNLVIPPDSDYVDYRMYRPTLQQMAEDFYETHNNYTELA